MKYKISSLLLSILFVVLPLLVLAETETKAQCYVFMVGWVDCAPSADGTLTPTTPITPITPITPATTPTISTNTTPTSPSTTGTGYVAGGGTMPPGMTPPATGIIYFSNAGGYYNPQTQTYSSNPNGTCEPNDACGTSYADFQSALVDKDIAKLGVPVPDYSNCLAGTVNTNSLQCGVYINGQYTTVGICPAGATTGSCSLERTNLAFATEAAKRRSLATGQSCSVDTLNWPGIDPVTSLNYSYSINCSGGSTSGGGGGTSSGGSTSQTSSSGQGGSTSAYINSLMNIVRSMITASQSAISRNTSVQNTNYVAPTVATQNTTTNTATTNTTNTTTTITSGNTLFTSNVSSVMYVGDPWSVFVSGLKPNETIYATGGKKTGSVVPTDKTPYVANSLGIMTKTGIHAADAVGDWQLVWTRADGTILKTLIFSVQNKIAGTGSDCLTFASGWIGCLPSSTPTTPTSAQPSTASFPMTVTVNIPILNIRTEPNTASRAINSFQNRATFTAGNIVDGENVEGNNKWFSFIYGTMPAYVWSGGTAQSPVAPTVTTFPVNVTVISTLPLNVRNAPNISAAVVKQLNNSDIFTAGNMVEGDSVEGNNKWWVTVEGTMPAYVWSGGAAVVH